MCLAPTPTAIRAMFTTRQAHNAHLSCITACHVKPDGLAANHTTPNFNKECTCSLLHQNLQRTVPAITGQHATSSCCLQLLYCCRRTNCAPYNSAVLAAALSATLCMTCSCPAGTITASTTCITLLQRAMSGFSTAAWLIGPMNVTWPSVVLACSD